MYSENLIKNNLFVFFFIFIAIVRAAMKKKVSYSIKVRVGEEGDITNAHCECPAGKGPHSTCKHVASICWLLVDFKKTGLIQTNKSCTDNLMTFHQPIKEHTGFKF